MPEEQAVIYCFAWSPNREHLAVGYSDGGLAIWDLVQMKAQLDEIGLGWYRSVLSLGRRGHIYSYSRCLILGEPA